MEELIRGGFIAGVLDITTTELADELAGGVLSAGPNRLEAAGEDGHPAGRLGRRPRHGQFRRARTVPAKYADRKFYRHNPLVTLMRTTVEENAALGGIDRRQAQPGQGADDLHDPAEGVSRRSTPKASRSTTRQPMRPFSRRSKSRSRQERDAGRDGHRHQRSGICHPGRRAAPRPSGGCGAPLSMRYAREQVAGRLRKVIAAGHPVIAAGAGIGLTAKFTERGGADLIVVYNSGRYRMTGYSSLAGYLPIGDANGIVKEMGEREVLPVTRATPVIAGVFAADPTREMGAFPRGAGPARLFRRDQLPGRGVARGRARAGLRILRPRLPAGARHDRAGARDRAVHPGLCLHGRGGCAHERRRCRLHCRAYGEHRRRLGRTGTGHRPRCGSEADAGNRRHGAGGQAGRDRAVPRRPDRYAAPTSPSSSSGPTSTVSSARRAWSGCRSRKRSRTSPGPSRPCRSAALRSAGAAPAGSGPQAREAKVKELRFAQIGSGLMGKAYAPALAQISDVVLAAGGDAAIARWSSTSTRKARARTPPVTATSAGAWAGRRRSTIPRLTSSWCLFRTTSTARSCSPPRLPASISVARSRSP